MRASLSLAWLAALASASAGLAGCVVPNWSLAGDDGPLSMEWRPQGSDGLAWQVRVRLAPYDGEMQAIGRCGSPLTATLHAASGASVDLLAHCEPAARTWFAVQPGEWVLDVRWDGKVPGAPAEPGMDVLVLRASVMQSADAQANTDRQRFTVLAGFPVRPGGELPPLGIALSIDRDPGAFAKAVVTATNEGSGYAYFRGGGCSTPFAWSVRDAAGNLVPTAPTSQDCTADIRDYRLAPGASWTFSVDWNGTRRADAPGRDGWQRVAAGTYELQVAVHASAHPPWPEMASKPPPDWPYQPLPMEGRMFVEVR